MCEQKSMGRKVRDLVLILLFRMKLYDLGNILWLWVLMSIIAKENLRWVAYLTYNLPSWISYMTSELVWEFVKFCSFRFMWNSTSQQYKEKLMSECISPPNAVSNDKRKYKTTRGAWMILSTISEIKSLPSYLMTDHLFWRLENKRI
jgi:hypothetical protein